MIEAIAGIGTAFGLSGSAGLNAYIPLLVVALASRFPIEDPLLKLSSPYDLLSSWWVIGILVILLVIEMLVDKVPAVDSINDVIQTFVRPAAGAILFAGSTSVISDMNPILAIIAGVLVAGGVHATKTVARPAVTATTAGTGNWAVSIVEDITAFVMSLLAIILPLLAGLLVLAIVMLIAWFFIRRRRRKKRKLTI
ncbi:MAG: DUF4126 domain-containing protein [Candidatus Promineifilaceae bacterium]|nr:DUF4126 domain-containing protein [Candidatus Promineifilaceae bacterium]